MNWREEKKTKLPVHPHQGLVLTESYSFETPDLKYAREAKSLGYPVFAYDPNPGIEPLFLPYFYKQDKDGKRIMGSLEDSYLFLTGVMGKGVFDGMIRTSWDDSGLPIQAWMLQFVAAAATEWQAALNDWSNQLFDTGEQVLNEAIDAAGDRGEALKQRAEALTEYRIARASQRTKWEQADGSND